MTGQSNRQRLLLAAVVLVYWGAGLAVGFFLDDVHNLEQALLAPLSPGGLANGFTVFDERSAEVWCLASTPVRFFRPLFLLSLKLDHLLWGGHAFGYHLTNLLLHIVNAWLVHALLLRLRVPATAALVGAALFAAFPHHTVAVLWISGRTELLLATFVLAAMALHARAIALGSRRALAASAGAAALACLTKESAVALPLYLLTLEVALRPAGAGWRAALRPAAMRLLPVAALTALYLAYRFVVFGGTGALPSPYFVSPGDPRFATVLAVKGVYYYFGWLTTFPIMPVAPVYFLLTHIAVLVGVTALTAVGWTLIVRRLRGEAALVPLVAWTVICQVPVAMVMTSNHYIYIGNAAVAGLFALLLARARRQRLWLGVLALLFAVHAAYGGVSYHLFSRGEHRMAAGIRQVAPEVAGPGRHLYLLNLPFVDAHVGQHLRVLDGAAGLRAHVLTVSSEPFGFGPAPVARWEDDRTLMLELPGGLFAGELGDMWRLMGAAPQPGHPHPDGPATVTPHADAEGRIVRLVVAFDAPPAQAGVTVVLFRPAGRMRAELVRLDPAGERSVHVDF